MWLTQLWEFGSRLIVHSTAHRAVSETSRTSRQQATPDFEALLEFLKRARGSDFTGYKRTSLMRRVDKRMQAVGVSDYADYVDYLEVHSEEFAPLIDTILINVTAFFRDPPMWEFLAGDIIPEYLLKQRPGYALRIWSAGCASGEEAYTLAIIMAEALGIDQFKQRVKIYATDVDENALNKARQSAYSEREVAGVPPTLLGRYFEAGSGGYVFRKDLRRQIIFGRHDLVQDAPISRTDLLVCRNTLMYFNAETQARLLAHFHYALNDGGVLFLGRAETLLTHGDTFTPIDLKRRTFIKVGRPGLSDRLLLLHRTGAQAEAATAARYDARDAAFEAGSVAQIIVDPDGALLLANEHARSLFSLAEADLGRYLQDLRLSYKPVDLRSSIEQAYAERRPVILSDVEWQPASGEQRWLQVQTTPLFEAAGAILGATITFTDVTAARRLQKELERSREELETAYEELQSTNEELETTNEELQATVEELETTNEELQSTNEELQTINEELRTRSDELNHVNAFMQSILASLPGAVVVMDGDFHVLIWSDQAEELWGLRRDEVEGRNFFALDIGLDTEQLKRPVEACLAGDRAEKIELIVGATNRRGRAIDCRIRCIPLLGSAEARGVIVVMEQLDSATPQFRTSK
jgi:two-component system CheB/CheR fusion protein